MQSGFGGVSEIQQFMVDGSAHPFFSISSTTPPPPNSGAAGAVGGHEIYHPAAIAPANKLFNTFHRHSGQYSQPTPPPTPHFPHFHSNIPITQQLFTPPPQPHHHHHHHFQLFQTNHHDHRRLLPTSPSLDHDPDPENSVTGPLLQGGGGPPPPFLHADMKFKLAIDDSSGGGSRHTFNNDNDVPAGILHGDNASESRLRSPWHREENCAIKEPFWRPLDLDYINCSNKRCKDKESAELHFAKRSRVTDELDNSHPGNSYKLFSELEAIYKPGGSNSTATEPANNNQTATHAANQTTGSDSALTGDDHPLIPPVTTAALDLDYHLEDDNSTGGEAQTNLKKSPHHSRRRHRRRRRRMKSIAAFFEGLLKQLMEHQESLHQKFLYAMEQRDKERVGQEETRREQEAARARREAVARAHDRELAAARESAILSFLEKITGETIDLPSYPIYAEKTDDVAKGGDFIAPTMMPTSRWPKTEVQALIQVRSELDGQFQEPGLKGPLWEEVSAAMSSMGYHRSAKRCKEKWENINKYFRKSKESGRKRSQHSKTCPYFHQLDQLYSKDNGRKVNNSELLDAVVVHGAGDEEARRTAVAQAELDEEEVVDESSQFVEQLP